MIYPSIMSIDTTNLNRGIKLASQYTKRTLPQLVNTAAYYIALNAKVETPFVPVKRIDEELSTVSIPVLGLRGKPLKRKKFFRSERMGTANPEVPLAVLIIQSQSRKPGGFRVRLPGGGVYIQKGSPFKGLPRTLGIQKMEALIDLMIKSRHSATHFLQAGWLPAIKALGLVIGRSVFGGSSTLTGGGPTFYNASLGSAKPAAERDYQSYAIIENNVGAEGIDESANKALMRYGAPALQKAIDTEGAKQMEYALRKSGTYLQRTVQPTWN